MNYDYNMEVLVKEDNFQVDTTAMTFFTHYCGWLPSAQSLHYFKYYSSPPDIRAKTQM